MGRARNFGWLMTNAEIDNADTYAERLNPTNRHQYWFNGKWTDMRRRMETIRVRQGDPVPLELDYTVHGVVTDWDVRNGRAFSRRIAGDTAHRLSGWSAMIDMGRAHDLKEFEKAVATLVSTFGVCYGDETGHIGFWSAGLYPLRAPGVDPRLPTPGTGEFEWTGYAKLADMPHVLDPKSGVIYSWNSLPMATWTFGENARYGETNRQAVDLALLAKKGPYVTMNAMVSLNREIASTFASGRTSATDPAFFIPYLRTAATASGKPELADLVEVMAGWDGLYTDADRDGFYDSPGLVVFETWLPIAYQTVLGATIGDWWHRIDDYKHIKYRASLLLRVMQGKQAGTPVIYDFFQGRGSQAVLQETLVKTLEQLRARYGGKPLRELRQPVYYRYFDPSKQEPSKPKSPVDKFFDYGDIAREAALHGYGPPFVRDNGGDEWVALMEISRGPREMHTVIDAGGQDLFIDANGQGNPHLTDQTRMHADLDLKTIPLDEQGIAATTESTQTLPVPALPAAKDMMR